MTKQQFFNFFFQIPIPIIDISTALYLNGYAKTAFHVDYTAIYITIFIPKQSENFNLFVRSHFQYFYLFGSQEATLSAL